MSDLAHQLPALQVLVPLMGAPVCFLIRRESWVRIFTIVLSWVTFGISLMLLGQVHGGEVVVYEFGDWARPIGIEYRVDVVNAFVVFLVTFIGAIVMIYAPRSVASELPGRSVSVPAV